MRERPVRRVVPGVLGVIAAAALAAGVLIDAPVTTIDGALAASQTIAAPVVDLPILERSSPGPQLGDTVRRAERDGRVGLAELRGIPVVVNFWASWCPFCVIEAPILEREWQSYRRDGVALLAINAQDTMKGAERFLGYYDTTFPNVRDGSNAVAAGWGVNRFPQTFFVTANGRVAAHATGVISPDVLARGIAAARSGRAMPAVSAGGSLPYGGRAARLGGAQ